MKIRISDKVISGNESTDEILMFGDCDIIISNLSSGSVKLQYKLTPTVAMPDPEWTDHPEGNFTENTFKTLRINDFGTLYRLTGVAVNALTYARLAFN